MIIPKEITTFFFNITMCMLTRLHVDSQHDKSDCRLSYFEISYFYSLYNIRPMNDFTQHQMDIKQRGWIDCLIHLFRFINNTL